MSDRQNKQERKRMAKYIFLQYVDESKSPRPGSPELNAVIDAFAKYLEDVKAAGVYHDGDPCQPSAATFSVTVHGSHAHTTDGPMHSASPWLNGFFVLDCKDRADAEAWAAKNPAAMFGGTIEVRANPTSAIPSTVLRPGRSYSSILTPRERSSASSASRSPTRHAACVCSSAVPTALLLSASRVPPPHRKVTP